MGLLTAIERYDFEKGFKFSTYATWWIKSAIDNELLALREITISRRTALELRQIARLEADWIDLTSVEPSPDEVASELEMSEARVRELKGLTLSAVRLNRRIDAGGHTELGDFLPERHPIDPDRALVCAERGRFVESALTGLSPDERDVIRRRFGFDGPIESLRNTAYARGESLRATRVIETSALEKLREATQGLLLADMLPDA